MYFIYKVEYELEDFELGGYGRFQLWSQKSGLGQKIPHTKGYTTDNNGKTKELRTLSSEQIKQFLLNLPTRYICAQIIFH